MGMAASQARFLGLTARKTNTEYEGQQINQQRTTLSNQSANYYNQLLGMSVPVPPSVADYTKTVYTFEDGNLNNSVTSLIAQAGGTYLVSYTSSWTDDFAAVAAASSIVTRTEIAGTDPKEYTYGVGAKQLSGMIDEIGGKKITACTDAELKAYVQGDEFKKRIDTDPYIAGLSIDQRANLLKEEAQYISKLDQQYGNATWMVRYQQNTSTGQYVPFFYKKEVLDSAIYSDTDSSQSNIPAYTIGSAKRTEEVKGTQAKLEQDASGRFINITLNPGSPDEVTYALTTQTLTDQAKYDDAMNQYEYDKQEYDQSIQEVNAKIEIIQTEDKNLELRLKQLDTEQKAIQTEMDAVSKVIEKNTESTFKTFG